MRAPLPDIPLVPTGGVDVEAVGAWLDAGAVAVGLGRPLIGNALAPDGDLNALAERARAVCAAAGARLLIERQLLAEHVRCLVRRDPAPTALMLRERRTATAARVSYHRLRLRRRHGRHPARPGLGIEVNEEYVRERAWEGHRWRDPIWRHADGSFAE